MPAILVDTNILVYAYDRGEFIKQQQSIRILEFLQASGAGRLSVQCLAEFFRVTTKGTSPILSVQQAQEQTEELAHSWQVLNLTPQIVLEATRGVREHQFSYWDAQIWACARLNQIPLVLSEDFQDGASIEGVRFLNPFAPEFEIQKIVG